MATPEKLLLAKRRRLARELTELQEMLSGTLVTKFLRCGKARCRCQEGRGHGPKYYVSDKFDGGTRMLYVPKSMLADVRQRLRQFRRFKKLGREISEVNRKLFLLGKKKSA